MQRLLKGSAAVFAATVLAGGATPETKAPVWFDIQPSGSAQVLQIDDHARRRIWTITCRVPLRGCVARAPGLVLRATQEGEVHLLTFAPPDARISVLHKTASRDMTQILHDPLSDDMIARLNMPQAELLVEASGEVLLRSSLTGIGTVADYLLWLNIAARNGVRDARAWSGGQTMSSVHADTALAATRPTPPQDMPHVIPRTKPQVEFAIRAQNGESVFDPTGH